MSLDIIGYKWFCLDMSWISVMDIMMDIDKDIKNIFNGYSIWITMDIIG
jgi:hypothetical protein